jgi:hypothetical protein
VFGSGKVFQILTSFVNATKVELSRSINFLGSKPELFGGSLSLLYNTFA